MAKRLNLRTDVIKPHPRQIELFDLVRSVLFVLYGGARGGGKSRGMRWGAVDFAVWVFQKHGIRHVRHGLFCETYPALHDRQLSKAILEFPPWLGKWNKQAKEFTLAPKYGAGVLCFRNLDEPSKYLSAEFASMWIDELTRNKVEVFTQLLGSLRWPGLEHTPFVGGTNPGGVGHTWVKDIWIKKTFGLDETRGLVTPAVEGEDPPYSPSDFAFLQAKVSDNPSNAASYIRKLQALPPRLRAAYLEGNWDVFEGQQFDELRRDVHLREVNPDTGWAGWCGLDWGYRDPGAFVYGYQGPAVNVVRWGYDFRHRKPYDVGFAVGQRLREGYLREHWPLPEIVSCGPDVSKQTQGEITIGELFQEGLDRGFETNRKGQKEPLPGVDAPPLFPWPASRGTRRARVTMAHEMFSYEMDPEDENKVAPWAEPSLLFDPRGAENVYQEIADLPMDPDDPDDVDTTAIDHRWDATSGALLARVPDFERPSHTREEMQQRAQLDAVSRREADSFDEVARKAAKRRG